MAGSPYGEAWTAGDVIGCALDLDSGVVSFARNGRDLGPAFTGVRPLAYYPAVSLGYGAAHWPHVTGTAPLAAACAAKAGADLRGQPPARVP